MSNAPANIRVTIWNENRHEKRKPEVAAIYPDGIHGHLARHLNKRGGYTVRTGTLDDPEHGLEVSVVDQTDVIVENFRPGTLERWELGYDNLKARNKGIILVRVSGYGQTGPDAGRAGYASVAEAASGLRHLNGFPGELPPRAGISLGDSLAGLFAAQGLLAALYRRDALGGGLRLL